MSSTLTCPAGITARQLSEGLDACEQIAAKDRSNLYLTSQFFEDRARYDAFIAMYSVMRLVDDFIDNVPDKARLAEAERAPLKAELDRWEQRIRAAYAGTPADDPVDAAFSAAVLTFPVPVRVWLNFVDAMRFDVDHPRFADWDQFLRYGEGATVAPTVIYVYLLTARRTAAGAYLVEGFDFEDCGRQLGLFAYVAHILRDVAQDLAVGQQGLVYLSVADLLAHGLDDQGLRGLVAAGTPDARWRALVQEVCARAHAMERKGVALADPQYAKMDRDCAFILNLIITVYQSLLARIEAEPHKVLKGDPMIDGIAKARLAMESAHRTGFPVSRVVGRMML